MEDLTEVFQTNVVGPAIIAQTFVSLVEKSTKKTIVNISSTLGSIGTDSGNICASYSVAKAGLNMLVRRSGCRHSIYPMRHTAHYSC